MVYAGWFARGPIAAAFQQIDWVSRSTVVPPRAGVLRPLCGAVMQAEPLRAVPNCATYVGINDRRCASDSWAYSIRRCGARK